MLLTSGVTWTGVDDNSFDLTLVDRGNTVTAGIFVDDDGHLVDFSTTDPYFTSPKGLQQALWTTPVDGWTWRLGAARCRGVRGPSGICRMATSAMGRIWPSRRSSSTWRRRQHGPARRAMDCRYSNWLMNAVGRVLPTAALGH